MAIWEKKPLALLVFAIVCAEVAGNAETAAPPVILDAVNVLNETSMFWFEFGIPRGDPTISPIPDGFPDKCTTCEAGLPTEYCNYESRECYKVSDGFVAKISANNGSLLSSHALTDAPPRYFVWIDWTTFVIVLRNFQYQVFRELENGTTVLEPPRSLNDHDDLADVTVVRVGNSFRLVLLYNDDYTYTYDPFSGHVYGSMYDYYEYESCEDSLSLQPTSAQRLFFLNCNINGQKTHFLCSVGNHLNCQQQEDLCGDLYTSPSGSYGPDSFATLCGATLTVYNTNNVTQISSMAFSSNVSSLAYLDKNTTLVDVGQQQSIIRVDSLFRNTSVEVTLKNAENCSQVRKLVDPDVYATACKNGSLSKVRFVNMTSGQELLPITNLLFEPINVYVSLLELPESVESTTQPVEAMGSATPVSSLPSSGAPNPTLTEMPFGSIPGPTETSPEKTSMMISSTTLPTGTSKIDKNLAAYIGASIVAVAMILFLASAIILLRYRQKSNSKMCDLRAQGNKLQDGIRREHPIEEENADTQSLPNFYMLQSNLIAFGATSSLASSSGYNSTCSSTNFTIPILDTQPHTTVQLQTSTN